MAIGAFFEDPSATQAQYDQVHEKVTPGNAPPAGLMYHVAGPSDNGGFCVFEVWESHEALDRFFQEKLGPALQEANISGNPKFFDVSNTMQP